MPQIAPGAVADPRAIVRVGACRPSFQPLPELLLRIALVCDGFTSFGGADRVVETLLQLYPSADLFALVDFVPQLARAGLGGRSVRTTFLQRLPFARRRFRAYLPLYPLAVESIDLRGYDLVISAQFAAAHGVITHPFQPHIAHISSPMRYAWDLQADHLELAGMRGARSAFARYLLHRLRLWDYAAGQRPDVLVANSHFVAERVRKYYRRESVVIHPPVALDRFSADAGHDGFYLSLGRLVPHKRVDLIVDAFAASPARRLIVAGGGPLLATLRASAPPNVAFVGEVDEDEAARLMSRARAFIHAAVEDFGIAPLEAQAAGTPVIAHGRGGLTETIVPVGAARPTGLFFAEQTAASLREAIDRFEALGEGAISAVDCRTNAERFDADRFRRAFAATVDAEVARQADAARGLGGTARR
jgi:glycosyltransferase involved in cell wall biosynthesis